ncbi:unnamed protein product [Caenorhabditis nigoni]
MSEAESLLLYDVVRSKGRDASFLANLKDRQTFSDNLNPAQHTAVRMALNDERPVVCIVGPPGTGKTHALSWLLMKLMTKSKKVIVFTPTKESSQVLKEMTMKQKITRCPDYQNALMDYSDYLDASSGKNGEQKSNEKVFENARVVFSKADGRFLDVVRNVFDPDVCVIDDAAQMKCSQSWPAWLEAKRIVLAGDKFQFATFAETNDRRHLDQNLSIFDHLLEKRSEFSWANLYEQQRSHDDIFHWSKYHIYEEESNRLTSRRGLDYWPSGTRLDKNLKLHLPVLFIDTASVFQSPEQEETFERLASHEDGHVSFANLGEAKYAMMHYKNLLNRGADPENVALIAPYNGQCDLMKKLMNEHIEESGNENCRKTKISTIDRIVGEEFIVVIFTLVRNNPKKWLGLASDVARLNLAVTRAKKQFMFIGSSFMLYNCGVPKIEQFFQEVLQCYRYQPVLLQDPSTAKIPASYIPRNNFGRNLEKFIEYSNDRDMIQMAERMAEGFQQNRPFHN